MEQTTGQQTGSASASSLGSSNNNTNNNPNFQSNRVPTRVAKLGANGDPALAKTRARNLLRDYYGLNQSGSTSPSQSESNQNRNTSAENFNNQLPISNTSISSTSSTSSTSSSNSATPVSNVFKSQQQGKHLNLNERDSLSIDSPNFDPDLYFKKLIKDSSLKTLISTANGIISDIRELDGERQNLVYNHHHELVEASETIGKMKNNAEKLDVTLDQLQNSFSSISQLLTTLSNSDLDENTNEKSGINNTNNTGSLESRKTTVNQDAGISNNELNSNFKPELHLSALINLPTILKGLVINKNSIKDKDNKDKNRGSLADQLWGKWEPSLRSFEEVGIKGVKEIGNECREVLRSQNGK